MDDTSAPLFDMFKGNRDYVQFQDETAGHFVLIGDEIETVWSRPAHVSSSSIPGSSL